MVSQSIEKALADETNILVNRIIEQGVDGIVGGFPCQDISFAGGGKGYNGMPPDLPQQDRDCSGRWLTPFAWFDLTTGSWKTWQHCLFEGWALFSGPWPPSGIMQNGIAWAREPLAHPIIVPEHTFLPTITASEHKGSSRSRYIGSQNLRIGKVSDVLRTSRDCPTFLNPSFAEKLMGLEIGYTLLETETPHVSSEN